MILTRRGRSAAIAVVAVAACTSPATSSTSTTVVLDPTTSTVVRTTTTMAPIRADDNLVFGLMLPGNDSAELAAALAVGARLAVDDINAVSATDQVLLESTTVSQGGEAAFERLLQARADVIIGPPLSALGEVLVPLAVEADVVLISPTNSSPTLTTLDDGGRYFRTAASDALQGSALASIVWESGTVGSIAVVFRDDEYGTAVVDRFVSEWTELAGPVPELIAYTPETGPDRTTTEAIAAADPDVVVLVGLDESAEVLVDLYEEGLAREATSIWASEPLFLELRSIVDDPTMLAGVGGLIHLPFPDLPVDLLDRVQDAPEQPSVLTYIAETYDAVTIAALAWRIAGSDATDALAGQIPDVTRVGEPCATYAGCLDLVDAGADIVYQGLAGPYEFTDDGEPSVAVYEWSRYGADGELGTPLGIVRGGLTP